MIRGKLIVFEGVSGTGKETQAKLLAGYLTRQNISSTIVYHPSPELKEILIKWRSERNIDHIMETYLLLADRQSRVHQLILPELARGEWVISLRSWVSALVYQGKTEEERSWMTKEFQRFEPPADYLFYFDITPDDAMERIMKRHRKSGEELGKFETPEYLTEKRDAYLSVLKKIPHIFLDASLSIEKIHSRITASLPL